MSLSRREFVEMTASTGAAMLLSSLDTFSSTNKFTSSMNQNFELNVLATSWGFHGNIDEFCAAAKKEGYDGIENWWPGDKKAQDDLFAALKKYDLKVGFLCAGSQSNYQEHLDTFKKMVDAAVNNTIQKPLYI